MHNHVDKRRQHLSEKDNQSKREESYMEKNTNWMASTNGVLRLWQVQFECIWASCFYNIHTHFIQGLNRFVNSSMAFVIMHVVEPKNRSPIDVKNNAKEYVYQVESNSRLRTLQCKHISFLYALIVHIEVIIKNLSDTTHMQSF